MSNEVESNVAVLENPTTLVVDRVQLVRICQLSGLSSADGWTNAQLLSRSCNLNEGDLDKMELDEDREMLDKILTANDDKVLFEVVGEKNQKEVVQSENGNEKNSGAVKVSRVKKESVLTKESKIDRFGCRLGCPSAMINAVLTNSPRTVASIAEELKLDVVRVAKHFSDWTKKGTGVGKYLVEVPGEGWKLDMEK